jgi:hypothetical protein
MLQVIWPKHVLLPGNGFLGKKNIFFAAVYVRESQCNIQVTTILVNHRDLCNLKLHISIFFM